MTEADQTTQLKRSLQAIKDLRTRLERSEHAQREPIAIIGMACRFPGGSDSPETFWNMLKNGADGITTTPSDRWNADAFFDTDPDTPGKISSRWGGFLSQINSFDAAFFGISPREAARMDPQQRLLLEVSWEALDDAGLDTKKLAGSHTGVFIGIHSQSSDYYLMQASDLNSMDMYTGTGTSHGVVSGRLAYLLDLHGPNVALDTACSSSLVAVHMAVQSLRNNECNLALAGGVNMMLTPHFTIATSHMRLMAADGRCKTFDARADGFVRGEGSGMIVLKRLSNAQADGDPILAIIRGSAVNQDGHSNGLTAPNGLSQQNVIRKALENASVPPEQITYVETHGTGTALGDPIEVEALTAVLGVSGTNHHPCFLGSVKTNIGHLEGAAGIAGLIKTVLALQHHTIPSNLHFQKLNPHISLADTRLKIASQEYPWQSSDESRFAGVSSFGWSGTNAHLILEEAPQTKTNQQTHPSHTSHTTEEVHPHYILPISARSSQALKALTQAYLEKLSIAELSLTDLCYSASLHRSHYDHRLAISGQTAERLIDGLSAYVNDESHSSLVTGYVEENRQPGLVFVFPGQGGQWVGMGRQLLAEDMTFKQAIERCTEAFQSHVDWNLIDILTSDDQSNRLEEIDVVQPVLFAIQVALTECLRAHGIVPEAVIGHSLGEVAAAHIAGALTLADAAHVICARSHLMRRLSGKGAMAVVELTADEAQDLLKDFSDKLSIAVSNSFRSTVLSGDRDALELLLKKLRDENIFYRMVKVDVAAHSPQMEAIRPELVKNIEEIKPQTTPIPMYSTVTTELISGQALNAEYWGYNLRQPVLFGKAIEQACQDGYSVFLEIGPHPILVQPIDTILQHNNIVGKAVSTLKRDEPDLSMLFNALGTLYVNGTAINWQAWQSSTARYIKLPSYPWQRETHWLEQTASRDRLSRQYSTSLVGEQVILADVTEKKVWESVFNRQNFAYLYEHRLNRAAIFPASAYIEMVILAARELYGEQELTFQNIEFLRALYLSENSDCILQTSLHHLGKNEWKFSIHSQINDEWIQHVTGQLKLEDASSLTKISPRKIPSTPELDKDKLYTRLAKNGITIGRRLQHIVSARQDSEGVYAHLEPIEAHRHLSLDGPFQLTVLSVPQDSEGVIYMPQKIGRLTWKPVEVTQPVCEIQVQPSNSKDESIQNLSLMDENGEQFASVTGFHLKRLGSTTPSLPDIFNVNWHDVTPSDTRKVTSTPGGLWIIFSDQDKVANNLVKHLHQAGKKTWLIQQGAAFSQEKNDVFTVRPNRKEDLKTIFEKALQSNQTHCQGIIYLWALDSKDEKTDQPVTEQNIGLFTALETVQVSAEIKWSQSPAFWLVTRGVQAIHSEQLPSLAQAPFWGLGRVIAEELRDMWGGMIDLDPNYHSEEAAAQIWEQINTDDEVQEIASYNHKRYILRLSQKKRPSGTTTLSLRPDGAYLITGGFGGVGFQVARWLIGQGARHIILMGRTPLPQRIEWTKVASSSPVGERIKAVKKLEALGASVHLACLDVSDASKLEDFLTQYTAESRPPIRGVIHAAAVIEDQLLTQLTEENFQKVLAPKMTGGWLLHQALPDVDFFVLFSSLGSLLGISGQGNYAAANAYLDSLAHYRRAKGLQAISINWGSWAGLGFAASNGGQHTVETLKSQGFGDFKAAHGLEALGQLLQSQDTAQAAVFTLDVKSFQEARKNIHLFDTSEMKSAHIDAIIDSTHDKERKIQDILLETHPEERMNFLISHVQKTIAQVLHMPAARIDIEQTLGSLGMDSLLAVELRNRLEIDLDIPLSATLVWNYPTILEMSSYLAKRLGTQPQEKTSTSPESERAESIDTDSSKTEQALKAVEDLSDEDALNQLRGSSP